MKQGVWPLIYHMIGNMIWFVPLGLIGPLSKKVFRTVQSTMMIGILLSVSIEVMQWVFHTGISDIDDIWLNVLGALAGYMIWYSLPFAWKNRISHYQ